MPRSRPAFPTQGNFWTPESKRVFHEHVTTLNEWNREPCGAEGYREINVEQSDAYVLLSGEEQHLTDHVAFLAQDKDGAKHVAAVTVEEDRVGESLTVRVAANQTPSPRTIQGLNEIFGVLEAYARKEMRREVGRDCLFDKVISFSQERILTRLKSKRLPQPSWSGQTVREPLHVRLRSKLVTLTGGKSNRSTVVQELRSKLEELAQRFEDVLSSSSSDQEELLKIAIRKSSAVSALGRGASLECHLKELKLGRQLYESREVLEIDKISRYFDLCNDLLRLSRKDHCRPLFSNIKLEPCIAPPPVKPPGAIDICHVHGEVQLVLYYERHPKDPPPRAIGSSKSACFLCDLFIKKHKHFRVSHSHKRLYHQWTIPDVDWMTAEQVQRFKGIVQEMSAELARLRKASKKSPQPVSNGLESRAHLLFPARPFAAPSTPSIFSQQTEIGAAPLTPPRTTSMCSDHSSTPEQESILAASASSVTLTSRDLSDLPLHKVITATTPSFELHIGKVSCVFEFLGVVNGSISIRRDDDRARQDSTHHDILIADVSSHSDMRINCPEMSKQLELRLSSPQNDAIFVTFDWDVG